MKLVCLKDEDVFIEAINNYSLHCSVEQHIILIMSLARLNFYKVQNIVFNRGSYSFLNVISEN